MHLTAPSYPAPQWSRSIGTSGRDPSERVVTIVGMRTCDVGAPMLAASQFDRAGSTRCVRRCGRSPITSRLNQPDNDPGDSSHEDIAGEQRPRCKSAQLRFVVAVEAGKLLVHVGQNRPTRARRQLRRRQHLIDCPGGKARCLVVRFENGPRCASRKSECSCLLVKREESGSDEGVPEFPDFARLSRLHFRHH